MSVRMWLYAIIKGWYYPPSRRLNVNVNTWWWVISPFYDFCSFWCVAVNTIDKLQILSLIFAVLLSITVHFIAHRLGSAIMHQHTEILLKWVQMIFDIMFFYFPNGNWPPCWIFKSIKFYLLRRSWARGTSLCQILSKLVNPYWDF